MTIVLITGPKATATCHPQNECPKILAGLFDFKLTPAQQRLSFAIPFKLLFLKIPYEYEVQKHQNLQHEASGKPQVLTTNKDLRLTTFGKALAASACYLQRSCGLWDRCSFFTQGFKSLQNKRHLEGIGYCGNQSANFVFTRVWVCRPKRPHSILVTTSSETVISRFIKKIMFAQDQ